MKVMDRPEMAGFKRTYEYAFKFRQSLMNFSNRLDQAKRTGFVNADGYKKLKAELDRLNDLEPSVARGGFKKADVDDFEKQINNFNEMLNKPSSAAAGMSVPAAAVAKDTKAAKAAKAAKANTTTAKTPAVPAKEAFSKMAASDKATNKTPSPKTTASTSAKK